MDSKIREEIAEVILRLPMRQRDVWTIANHLTRLIRQSHQDGQEAMRERAAKVAEQHAKDAVTIDALIADSVASAIRSLPLSDKE